ncbi:N-formyl peptide receptor 2 [Biomphalaria glabrata]|nr:N-formyl peptide receptor 2 [Biomphalaria glabrata]
MNSTMQEETTVWGLKETSNFSQSIISPEGHSALVSDVFVKTFGSIVDMWMSLIISLIGVCGNIITLVVFYRLGFMDTVNITMGAITAWDLVRVLCGSVHRLYGPVSLVSEAVGVSWQNVTLVNIVYMHIVAGNVSYVIGGYVALERCLCVSFPFKVKSIITPRLTMAVCLTISISVFASQFPIFLVFEYQWVYSQLYGQDVAIYQYTHFYSVHGQKFMESYRYFSFLYPLLSLSFMVVSTVIISYHLQKASDFRNKVSAATKHQDGIRSEMSARDRQVVKMLLAVIVIYMIVLVPRVAHFVTMLCEAEYYTLRYYNNIFWVVLYSVSFLDLLNSTCNLLIFYSMSSRFRYCVRSMASHFLCCMASPKSSKTTLNDTT